MFVGLQPSLDYEDAPAMGVRFVSSARLRPAGPFHARCGSPAADLLD
jgi:hypothetical protein